MILDKIVYQCRVLFLGDARQTVSYNQDDTTNKLVNDGKTNEDFLTVKFCPNLPSEHDEVCRACEQLNESYKELCLIDLCLMAGVWDRSQCYRLIGELLKR